jgi:protein-S-isoprenylcysteine O-methyltransferase Ste14
VSAASIHRIDGFHTHHGVGIGRASGSGQVGMQSPTTPSSTHINKTYPLANIRMGVMSPMSGISESNDISERRRDHIPSNLKRITTLATVTLTMVLATLTSNTGIAHAAKKSATTILSSSGGPVAVVSALVLPSIPTLAMACLLPTLLGYYRSEYGVSYGYGTAIAASSYLIFSSIANSAGLPLLPGIKDAILPLSNFQLAAIFTSLKSTTTNIRTLLPSSLAACHAYALFFYGKRLNIFLLYRELCLPRFRAMRERIEERSKKQGARWRRTPFLASCAFLYFCMMCPLLITSQVCGGDLSMMPSCCIAGGGGTSGGSRLVSVLESCLRCSVLTTFLGFLLGALGDMNKTLGKKWKGEDTLITGGIFRFLRHPNYTGEVIGWISSCLAGILAVSWKTVQSGSGCSSCLALWKSMAPYLVLSVLGATGITFVLATATTGLEYRQKEKYGDTEEYQRWIKSSWVGFKMAPKKEKSRDGETKENGDEKVKS